MDILISIAQVNVKIGDFNQIFKQVAKNIEIAKKQNADIIVFPELIVSGYFSSDYLQKSSFIGEVEEVLQKIKLLSNDIAIIIGAPTKDTYTKKLRNSALCFYNQSLIHITHKSLIPNYDIFDESRYFEPATSIEVVEFKGYRIAITIGEDLCDVNNNQFEYNIKVADELVKQKPSLIINIASSPFDYLKESEINDRLIKNAQKYNLPIVYVNAVGAQGELIFDGGSKFINAQGQIVSQLPFFEEVQQTISLSSVNAKQAEEYLFQTDSEKIYNALVLGIKDYFKKSNFKTAIIGLSGGIDSALVVSLATVALGKDNVFCIYMPTQYSSDSSNKDAKTLAENLGVNFEIISIENTFVHFLNLLSPHMGKLPIDTTEENIQARIRGLILMAYSNKFGHILLNTSNKSEIACGYGTLYGDMCGALAVIGDVYKTQVYDLCRFINKDIEIIPNNILIKEPSAELRLHQKDTDSLPPYSVLDAILFQYIEMNQDIQTISQNLSVDVQEVSRIVRMTNQSEFKRFQAAPILRVSPKAFGKGRRFPIVGNY